MTSGTKNEHTHSWQGQFCRGAGVSHSESMEVLVHRLVSLKYRCSSELILNGFVPPANTIFLFNLCHDQHSRCHNHSDGERQRVTSFTVHMDLASRSPTFQTVREARPGRQG